MSVGFLYRPVHSIPIFLSIVKDILLSKYWNQRYAIDFDFLNNFYSDHGINFSALFSTNLVEIGAPLFVMRCTIWYHLYNFQNEKTTHGRVLRGEWPRGRMT